MSRGDVLSGAVTLLVGGAAYFIGGAKVAAVCMGVGIVGILAAHFWPKERQDSGPTPTNITVNPNISPNISPTISPTFNVGVQPSPADRPKITFKKWGTRGQTMDFWESGFILENHGAEAALDVRVVRFKIADNVFADSSAISTIGEYQEDFALVWIEGLPCTLFKMEKWDLLAAMKKAAGVKDGGHTVSVSVMYTDFDKRRYISTADLSYIPSRGELSFGATVQQRIM